MLGHQRAEKGLIFGFVFPGEHRVPRQHAVAESVKPRHLVVAKASDLSRSRHRVHRRRLLAWSDRSSLGENVLCANGEHEVQPLLAFLDLLHDARVRLPSHPFWLRRRRHLWPIVVSAELAVETRKVVVRLIHWPDALDIIAEPIAMTAGKETATSVELGNPAAAIHSIGADIADKPGSLTAEAARGPRIGTRCSTDCHSWPYDLKRYFSVISSLPSSMSIHARVPSLYVHCQLAWRLPDRKPARASFITSSERVPSTVPPPFQLCPPRDIGSRSSDGFQGTRDHWPMETLASSRRLRHAPEELAIILP